MSAGRWEGATEVQTPRRPQRLKRCTPLARTEPAALVQKLRTKFESGGQEQRNGEAPERPNGVSAANAVAERNQRRVDSSYARRNGSGAADRPVSGGAARGGFRKAAGDAAPAKDNRTWVLQRARQYERASATPPRSSGARPSRSVMSAPPVKPPRTFAHDIYTESKLRDNPLYGVSARRRDIVLSLDGASVGHDYDEVCVPRCSAAGTDRASGLRRSRSDEHIYAEPGALKPGRSASQCDGASAPRELHYMSSPISGAVLKEGALSPGARRGARAFTSLVRDAIHQSFTERKGGKRPEEAPPGGDAQADSGSEVSAKDLEKRLVYVRSVKRAALYPPEDPACCTEAPGPLLEFALLVGYRPLAGVGTPQPDVLHHFPPQLDCPGYDPVVVSHLCMPQPFDSEDAAAPDRRLFFFTLVQNGERTFFHCLQTPRGPGGALAGSVQTPVVLCLATRVSAPAFYHQLLGQLERPLLSLDREGWEQLLSQLAKQGLPSPGCRMVCQRLPPATQGRGDVAIAFTRPLDEQFDWAQLTPLLGVEPAVLLRMVSSLVLERRLILVSDSCDLVRGWVSSVESLVYPFRWPHVRVPLVPRSLLAQCSSTEPYLLGVHASLAHTMLELLTGPVLVVDVDRGALLREDEDNRGVLPDKLQRSLCNALSLANSMTDPTGRVRDVMIREACVRLFVELVGHCDQHLSPEDSSFQREAFVRAPASRGTQLFLQWFVETQAFEQFLRERAQRLRQLARTPQHHLLPKGLFERRAAEYLLDLEQSGRGLRQLGRRVRTIGERFWNLRAFQRD